ncbi:MAG: threonine synthase [Candidatus Geothermarchaeales archaeon]
MRFTYRCWSCGEEYQPSELLYRCSICGHPLEVRQTRRTKPPSSNSIHKRTASIWRYHELLPVQPEDRISLGEGYTPVVASRRVGKETGVRNLFFKNESSNPTGTFKDRASSVLVSIARTYGFGRVSIDSSGNAASSLACYAARGRLKCTVFLPKGTSGSKITQSELYGAQSIVVDGDRRETFEAAERTTTSTGNMYCGYLLNPFPLHGMKTIGFELCEQFDWNPPEFVAFPVGTATGLIGSWLGFEQMLEMGWVSRLPKLICVQPEGCAPIARSWKEKTVQSVGQADTVAEGLRITRPTRLREAVSVIDDSGGRAETVSDRSIMEAGFLLMREEGLLVEPSSAASLAGVLKLAQKGYIEDDERVLCVLTGSGLKTIDVYETFQRRNHVAIRDTETIRTSSA